MEFLPKRELEAHDKFLRAGVTRTDVDHILAAHLENGKQPEYEELVDSVEDIKRVYNKARDIFGERLTFAGPDCGLGSWPSQEVAHLLLKRTVKAINM